MGKERSSNIELLRIVLMNIIIAHHYVVNSEIINIINNHNAHDAKDIFYMIFGSGGKMAINIFVLITGYYMCQSRITMKKFLKLFLEVEFYKCAIFFAFIVSGYEEITVRGVIDAINPFHNLVTGFVGCYLIFYLLIPFINKLIQGLNQREQAILLGICFSVATVYGTFLNRIQVNYITWFIIIYLLGAYVRLYPGSWWNNGKRAGIMLLILAPVVLFSIPELNFILVEDVNRIFAVIVALLIFIFFKNIDIGYHKWINTMASTTFGVLLIHANSDTMRGWLWRDVLRNAECFESKHFVMYAIGGVAFVYCLCVLIDLCRIHFIEWYLFRILEACNYKRIMNISRKGK